MGDVEHRAEEAWTAYGDVPADQWGYQHDCFIAGFKAAIQQDREKLRRLQAVAKAAIGVNYKPKALWGALDALLEGDLEDG